MFPKPPVPSSPNEGDKRSWDIGICQAFNLTSLTSLGPHSSFPRVGLFDLSLTYLIEAPPSSSLFPPSSLPPTTSSPPAQPPAPPPPMPPRGAEERPSRLSLSRDLDEAVAGQPAAPPPPPGLQSQMEWDEEEVVVAPPRAQNKVRQRVREVMYRRLAAAAAAIQQVNRSDVKPPQHGPPIPVKEMRKAGSVRNARIGIERRRKYEVCLPPFTLRIH
jgi:hypothetical protein